MSLRRVGVCIVGCGGFAAAHAHAFRTLRGVRLLFSSRDPERARAFAARFGGEPAGAFPDACRDPRVHAVVLSSPHNLHLPQVRTAAAAGKAILLEKPLARSVAEGVRMLPLAGRVPFMLAENYAFIPHLAAAKRVLARGTIGPPRAFRAVCCWPADIGGWRFSRRRMGGGILIDVGVHFLRLFQMLFGRVVAVRTARASRPLRAMEGESEIETELRFASGVEGTLLLSWRRPRKRRVHELTILGARGRLTVPLRGTDLAVVKGRRRSAVRVPAGDLSGMKAQARSFVRCLRSGAAPPVGPREGLEDLRVVEAAYRSMRSAGRWVRVRS